MLRTRWAKVCLFMLAAVFLAAHFIHLQADYPRHMVWEHGVATDEGWYASSAIHRQTWGTWLLPGDFNTVVAVPVWQWMVAAVFRVVGFGIVPLRAAAVAMFIGCIFLVGRIARRYGAAEWVPLLMFLLAVHPLCFVLSRNGFLEFPLLFFFLLAAWAVIGARPGSMVLAGICFALAVLTKTTALVLFPALAYVVLQVEGFEWRPALKRLIVLGAASGTVLGSYWLLYARRHVADWNYLLSQNASTFRFTPYAVIADLSRPIRSGVGADVLLFPLCVVVLVASVLVTRVRTLWRNPLYAFPAMLMVCYLGFMAEHNHAPVRYYAVIVPALMMMAVGVLQSLQQRKDLRLYNVFLVLLLLNGAVNSMRVVGFVLHPSYSFRDANAAIGNVIDNDPDGNRVVLADNSHELALFEGTNPVNLIWHADAVDGLVTRFQPGWWVQFTHADDGSCFREVLASRYRAEKRGTWQIFEGYSDLVLWKLVPVAGAKMAGPLSAEQAAACSPPVYRPSPREGTLFRSARPF